MGGRIPRGEQAAEGAGDLRLAAGSRGFEYRTSSGCAGLFKGSGGAPEPTRGARVLPLHSGRVCSPYTRGACAPLIRGVLALGSSRALLTLGSFEAALAHGGGTALMGDGLD